MFTDDVNFCVNGKVNRQNMRYCSNASLVWMSSTKMQDAGKVMIRAGLWADKTIGSIFDDESLNAEVSQYVNIFPSLLPNKDNNFPGYFQHDGGPYHYPIQVHQWLD